VTRPNEQEATIIRLERERGELMEAVENAAAIYEIEVIRWNDNPVLKAGWVALERRARALLTKMKETT
jgi:hypothetical protein